jgi:hypothetical protein
MTATVNDYSLAKNEEPSLVSGLGQHHSDRNKAKPQAYLIISLSEIEAMLSTPQQVEKAKARWFIPSTLMDRNHSNQRSAGQYWALWAETDEPTATLSDMVTAISAKLPGVQILAYTTRSATEKKQKARFILPLDETIDGKTFIIMQRICNRILAEANIVPDCSNERAGQLCYLPNRGDFYATQNLLGDPLSQSMWSGRISQAIVKQNQELKAQTERMAAAKVRQYKRQQTDQQSPLDAFNEAYGLPLLLAQYGYLKKGLKWLSPNSSSNSPGVTIKGDRWISSHESDRDDDVGKANENGASGDAFDLFKFYEHGNDLNAALKALGSAFTTSDGTTVTKSNQRNYMQQAASDGVMGSAIAITSGAELDKPGLVYDISKYRAINLLHNTPPPRRYVIDGFLPEPITAAIVAPGSTGKSFYLMPIAACVASGLPFFGCNISQAGGVLMLAAEDDQDELSRRLHAIRDRLKFNSDLTDDQEKLLGENFYPVTRLADDNRITVKLNGTVDWNSTLINSITSTAKDIPDLRLIILDPVARFRAGDENANEDATKFVEALEKIRKETGVTVLCAHHSRKGGTGESAEDIRGASAFVDALRFAATLYCPSVDDAKKLGIAEDERRSWVRMMVVKSNYKTDVDVQWYRRAEGGVLALTAEPAGRPTKTVDKAEERYFAALPKIKELIKQADEKGDPTTERKFRDHGGVEGVFRMGVGSVTACVSRALLEGKIHKGDDGKLRLY